MKVAFKTHKKIDIFLKNGRGNWTYECSTMASKTCKEAKRIFCARHCLDKTQVKCNFCK